MRMHGDHRPSEMLLRSRVSRPRVRFYMLSWFVGPNGASVNDEILRKLSPQQLEANTTRGSTPGLLDPYVIFGASHSSFL